MCKSEMGGRNVWDAVDGGNGVGAGEKREKKNLRRNRTCACSCSLAPRKAGSRRKEWDKFGRDLTNAWNGREWNVM